MPLAHDRAVIFVGSANHKTAKAFYTEKLGLTLVSEDDFAAVFDLAGTMLRLSTIGSSFKAQPHTVLGWIVPDIRAAIAALSARGVKFEIYEGFDQDEAGIWSAPGGGTKIAWFNDPEGNILSLTQFS